jgi:hypothetical protein
MSSQTRTARRKIIIRVLARLDRPLDSLSLTMLAAFCYKNRSCSARD